MPASSGTRLLLLTLMAGLLAGCGAGGLPTGPSAAPSGVAARDAPAAGGSSAGSTAAPSTPAAPSNSTAAGAAVSGTFTIGSPSTATYTASETFLQQNLPETPVGTTATVSGTLLLKDGRFQPSAITVGLTGLSTGNAMRDRRVQQTLETSAHPTATYAITGEPAGAPAVVAGGSVAVTISGNLTIDGVTKPETWTGRVVATATGLQATATTALQFSDFGLTPPSVAGFVSVKPAITLGVNLTAQ